MKLLERIKVSKDQTMCVYQLSEEQSKRSGGQFVLTHREYSDSNIRQYGELRIVSELRDHAYEGVFQTQKEAYLQAKLVAMKHQIDYVKTHFKGIHLDDINW